MMINLEKLISLSPLLIVLFTIIIILLCMICKVNNVINNVITTIGFHSALVSLWFVWHNGIQYITPLIYIDFSSIFYTSLILLISIVTNILSYYWLTNFYKKKCNEFCLLLLIATIGGILLTSTNHLAVLFLGIELVSLPLFSMIGFIYEKKYSLEASIKYMILSAISLSFIIFGTALIYTSTGELNFNKINNNFHYITIHKSLLMSGLGMIIIGISFKLSLAPFHLWTPDIYQCTSIPTLFFLNTANKISIFIALIRLFSFIPAINNDTIKFVLVIISLCSMIFGSLMMLHEKNIKRILGYSSTVHFGYLLIGLINIQSSDLTLETINIYLISYVFTNIGIFVIISLLSHSDDNNNYLLYFYRGIFWYKPVLSVILTVMMFSLAGIPMTLGFIGKFYLFFINIKNKLLWIIIFPMILSSIISLLCYLRVITNLYLLPSNKNQNFNFNLNKIGINNLWIFILFSLFVILINGTYPQPLINLMKLLRY